MFGDDQKGLGVRLQHICAPCCSYLGSAVANAVQGDALFGKYTLNLSNYYLLWFLCKQYRNRLYHAIINSNKIVTNAFFCVFVFFFLLFFYVFCIPIYYFICMSWTYNYNKSLFEDNLTVPICYCYVIIYFIVCFNLFI